MNQHFPLEHMSMKYCSAIAVNAKFILKWFIVTTPTVVWGPFALHWDAVRLLYIKVGMYFYIMIYSFTMSYSHLRGGMIQDYHHKQ